MDKFILKLSEIGVVKFGDFTLKSGIRSPIYIDLRILIAYPKILKETADMMWNLVKDENYDQICGVPYTALPIATIVSLEQNIPMIIKRKEQKAYGTKKQLEGVWNTDDSCLLIEDVIVSGSSVLETIEALKREYLVVKQTIVFIDRQQGGKINLEKEGIKVKSVFTLDHIVNVLLNKGKIDLELAENVRTFIKNNSNVPIPISHGRNDSNYTNTGKIPLSTRLELTENIVTKKLFKIMLEKETNLCVSADVCSSEELLNIADKVGPHICILKTHIDMLQDFTVNTIDKLTKKAVEYNFLLMEDRKFADIGKTVQSQYSHGMYKIMTYADLVTVHGLPGHGVITGLKSVAGNTQAAIIVAEMSSKGNLCDNSYTKGCVAIAADNPDFVIGFVAQSGVSSDAGHVIMTPGISLNSSSDSLGQQYKSPTEAIKHGSDILIVGRAIISENDIGAAAKEYKEIGYSAFVNNGKQ